MGVLYLYTLFLCIGFFAPSCRKSVGGLSVYLPQKTINERCKAMNEFNERPSEYFEKETMNVSGNNDNRRKGVVTTIAFLIGVPDEMIANGRNFEIEDYERLKNDESANVIRCLCILRTQFLKNYGKIDEARNFYMRSLEQMTSLIDVEKIRYLRDRGIEVNVHCAKSPTDNIAYLNQYIQNRVDDIKKFLPEWIKFQFVRALFLMPGGYSGNNGELLKRNGRKVYNVIGEAGRKFKAQRSYYPYQTYISWPGDLREKDGNVLRNDQKFLRMLYAACGDSFQANEYVVDARAESKEGIYKYLVSAVNAAMFVDCENVCPYALGATILNLDKALLKKIKKIVLYYDKKASTAWNYFESITDIPVNMKTVDRVMEKKSLVDVTMSLDISNEHSENDIESVILVSSDSDFLAVINKLSKARFLVLNECRKTSGVTINILDERQIEHCYMNEFAQDSIQWFKSEVLYLGLQKRIEQFNATGAFCDLNANSLIDSLFLEARITGAETQIKKEKESFFNKYLKNGLLLKPVEENGTQQLRIELQRK